jgi:hypothetical protein
MGINNMQIFEALRTKDAGKSIADAIDKALNNDTANNKVAQQAKGAKDSSNTRLSGKDIKQQMLDNFDQKTNTTKFGDTTVTFSGIADPKKAISGVNDKTLSVLGDITSKNKITDMTLTSAARDPLTTTWEGDPHRFEPYRNPGGGRGLDITYMKSSDGREALFQDKNYASPRSESSLAKDITKDLQTHKDVKQVFTPWQMKYSPNSDPIPNTWRDKAGQTPKSNDEWHNNHLHLGI